MKVSAEVSTMSMDDRVKQTMCQLKLQMQASVGYLVNSATLTVADNMEDQSALEYDTRMYLKTLTRIKKMESAVAEIMKIAKETGIE